MTLDEAIKHAEEVAEKKFDDAVYIMDKMKSDVALRDAEECKKCAEEHRQLAEWLKDYKRLLEPEPTTKNDLGVDTDKLIAHCEKMSFDFELFGRHTKALLLDAVKNIVKDLSSVAQQEPRWIPVSERLPEEDGEYLVTTINGDVDIYVFHTWGANQHKVIAWMPLPKSYESRESEK